MKLLVSVALLNFVAQSTLVDADTFYVGTMTDHGTSQGIYRGSIDPETGQLGPLTLASEVKSPNFLALSPDHHFLYSALDPGVASFEVKADGNLRLLNSEPSGGDGTCHVAVDNTGKHVFIANYNAATVACFPINSDGSLGERTALMSFTGSGPHPQRQKKSYAHSIYPDPENQHVYSCDLGSDRIWIYKFDEDHGTMTPNDPPFATVPAGSGPRHLTFHPGGKFVYVANEMGASVSVFARDAATGTLQPIETVSTLAEPPTNPKVTITTAEVVCHPSGKWLYVSNRGCETMSVMAIAPDGKLKLLQSTPSPVRFPRSFDVDSSGKWLIVAGQKDNRIAVERIDPETGELTRTDQSATLGIPVCVLFVPKR